MILILSIMTEKDVKVCSQCHSKCLLKEFKENRLGVLGKSCERCRERKIKVCKKYRDSHKEQIKKHNIDVKEKTAERWKKYYEQHKDEIIAYNKKRYEGKKDEILESQKIYASKHKEEIATRLKEYRTKNKEELKQKKKKYYTENKDEIEKHKKHYYEQNKDEILKKCKQYVKSSLDIIIKHKIQGNKNSDDKYGRSYSEDEYITSDWVKDRLIKCTNNCELCGKGLKLTGYEFRDHDQFSIDRIDNKIAHIQSNCQITCWGCNLDKH